MQRAIDNQAVPAAGNLTRTLDVRRYNRLLILAKMTTDVAADLVIEARAVDGADAVWGQVLVAEAEIPPVLVGAESLAQAQFGLHGLNRVEVRVVNADGVTPHDATVDVGLA